MLACRKEQGQGLLEYALLLIVIAIALILLVTIFGGQVGNLFSQVTNKMP
jgi:pilus assembly protein Flp/PilA